MYRFHRASSGYLGYGRAAGAGSGSRATGLVATTNRNGHHDRSHPQDVPAFNGIVIGIRREKINLTSMWEAAGSPPEQRPGDWKKDKGNRIFLDHVATIVNAPIEGIWSGTRGVGGATWAHWHIGLAYARSLSPEFHVWCNAVIRTIMEGRDNAHGTQSIAPALVAKIAGLEASIAALTAIVTAQSDHVRAMIITNDPRLAAVHYKPSLEIARECGAPADKNRRGLVRSITSRLTWLCIEMGMTATKSPNRTHLFPIAVRDRWLNMGGRQFIADFVSRQTPKKEPEQGRLFGADVVPISRGRRAPVATA